MHSRRTIVASGLAILVAFLSLLAWRAKVWDERGWTGLRFVAGPPDDVKLPPMLAGTIPKAGRVDVVLPGSPAAAAGIRPLDTIESIDGIRIQDLRRIKSRGDVARKGDRVRYWIVREGRGRQIEVRSVSPLELPIVTSGIVTGVAMMLAFLAIALLVLWHRPRSRPAIVFYWFCVLGSAWAGATSFLDLEMVPADGIYPAFSRMGIFLWYLAVLALAAAFGAVLLHLSLVFPREFVILVQRPWLVGWIYVAPIALSALPFFVISVLTTEYTWGRMTVGTLFCLLTLLLLARGRGRPWHHRPLSAVSTVFSFLLAALAFVAVDTTPLTVAIIVGATVLISVVSALISTFGYALATIAALVKGYRGSTAEEKRQVRWPLWGTLSALSFATLMAIVLLIPTTHDRSAFMLPLLALGRLVYLLIPLSFAFAILKYRLMDIDIVIKKTVVYSVATGVVVAAFFLLVGGIGSYLTAQLNIKSQTLTVVATLAVAAVFVPLRNRVQRSVERRFFQRSYDASEAEKLIHQEIVAATDLESLLPRIAEVVQQALQVRSVVLFTPRADDTSMFRPAALIGIARETIGAFTLDAASIARVSGVTDISAMRLSDDERARLRKVHAELVVPLELRKRTHGVMLVGSVLSGRFDQDDRHFLEAVAQQIAFAIEKLTVTEERLDFERALEIQRALLPKALPHVPGVDIDAAWLPARTVGGDYYDVLPLGPHMLGFCIGDVAGKGMPAALLMANLQAAVKASASADLLPHTVCSKVGTVVNGTLTGGRFVTFFYATLDPREMVLRYTNAGHNPPLLLRADGTVTLLAGGGPVFARLMQGAPYDTHEERLRPGDTVVLFTDGVTEAREANDEEFGEERLVALARGGPSASDVVSRIVVDVQRFCGGAAQDDLTLLVVRV